MRTIIPGLVACLLVLGSLPSRANELELQAMVPDHVGLTAQPSPVLYFYISHATSYPVRFTLFDVRQASPLAEFLLPSPTRPGMWAIRLEDYHIVLEEQVQYRWFVSVTRDPDRHQEDIVAGGVIERIDPRSIDPRAMDYYGRPCDKDSVRLFAKAGLWYDAMACLNKLIEADPQDDSLRHLRYELLREVGIILLAAN
jgi:hypothetical protein